MKIYLEFIIILTLLLVFFSWSVWFNYSKKKLMKEYDLGKDMSGEAHKLQNDNNQKGGIFNDGGSPETESGTSTNSPDTIRHEQLEGGRLLQEADVNNVRTNSDSGGKNCSTLRKRFFRRKK